jgi:hypothetical protein
LRSSSPLEAAERWCEKPGSFVLLSEFYREDAERARRLGWPVIECLGGHRDIVSDTDNIAHMILEVAR